MLLFELCLNIILRILCFKGFYDILAIKSSKIARMSFICLSFLPLVAVRNALNGNQQNFVLFFVLQLFDVL